jgi:hypothetical protein
MLMSLVQAQQSYACMDANGTAYLLNQPPKSVPPGLAVLRLKPPIAEPTSKGADDGPQLVAVTLAGGDPRLTGKRVLIEVPIGDSCSYWAQSDRSRFVVGKLYRVAGQLRLRPKAYMIRNR